MQVIRVLECFNLTTFFKHLNPSNSWTGFAETQKFESKVNSSSGTLILLVITIRSCSTRDAGISKLRLEPKLYHNLVYKFVKLLKTVQR